MQDVFHDFHRELLRLSSKKKQTAYTYIVKERGIHPTVVRDSAIGAVPSGFDVDAVFVPLIKAAKQAIREEKKRRGGKRQRPEAGPTPAETHLKFLREAKKKLRRCVAGGQGWIAFFHCDAQHRIASIRFRKPYTKQILWFKPFPDAGLFGHDLFSESNASENDGIENPFIVTEGELNVLQLQSARIRYQKASGEPQSYLHACAVGSASSPDFESIRAISGRPIFCHDNDGAGRMMVEKAQKVMSLEAFTTPEPDSDLDEFLISFGKKRPRAAWFAFDKLLADRKFYARDFENVAAEIFAIRQQPKVREFQIKRDVSRKILADLHERGQFFNDGQLAYIFQTGNRQLIEINPENQDFILLLDNYGVNSTEDIFKYSAKELWAQAMKHGTKTDVHRLAHFQADSFTLYVFNHENRIYRITSTNIELFDNGVDGILFLKDGNHYPILQKRKPPKHDLFAKLIVNKINFADDVLSPSERRILFEYWFYSMFFQSILPTKPILAFIGEKGSGKSLTLRLVGQFLFGEKFDVSPLSRDPKDFDAAVTNTAYLAIDNADDPVSWLNDRLATAATGGTLKRRELYTTNRLVEFPIKCFVAITSRTPEFRRDDVADRLLLMRVERIQNFLSDKSLSDAVLKVRNKMWSQVIQTLQKIVVALETSPNAQESGSFRMADFFDFSIKVARARGIEKKVRRIFKKLGQEQSSFTLENEPIYDLLRVWVKDKKNSGRWISTKVLCYELARASRATGIEFLHENNSRGFAQLLAQLRPNREEFFEIKARTGGGRKRLFSFKFRKRRRNPKKTAKKGQK